MLNKKSFLSLAAIFVLLALPGIAIAQQVDIKTGNTRTVIDDDGEVYVEIEPSASSNQTSLKPRKNSSISRPTTGKQSDSNCHIESSTYKNNEGGNSVYSHSSTTICQ